MVQHVFVGEGEPTEITPNNAGDHYCDIGAYPCRTYTAQGVPGDFDWGFIPTVSLTELPPLSLPEGAPIMNEQGGCISGVDDWTVLASVDIGTFPGPAVYGRLWITQPEAITQGVGIANGDSYKMLATIEVGDTAPAAAGGREPGLYLNNQTGTLFVCDGLGSWFEIPTTLVE